ncbi:histamine H2 receptor [Nematostella vectensis]|uniref:histamine H2 receptor n=1 Tax=Nematostella vectensis TaxID=45351 RepID=UPI00138FB601|nr:histamine H2 receptor [Nematostella vectensis]
MLSGNLSTRPCSFLVYKPQTIRLVRDAYIAAAAINCITMFPTIILNVLLMRAMSRSPVLRKPSTLLLYSVSASDLLLGLIVQPGYIAKKIGEFTDNFQIYCKSGILTYTMGNLLVGVSFLNLTAISFDRLLIVTSGLRYPRNVTMLRVVIVIASIWVLMASISASQFIITRTTAFTLAALLIGSSVAITTICYILAVRKINQHKTSKIFVNSSETQRVSNVARYKKSTQTMLLVFVVFLLCYTPYLVVITTAAIIGETADVWSAEAICTVLVYSNSCLNPTILFFRMREIRNAGKQLFRKNRVAMAIEEPTLSITRTVRNHNTVAILEIIEENSHNRPIPVE